MNILVACEESQAVCKAFRERGHKAFSCDVQPCSGGHPEWHIQGDCLPLINGNCTFTTEDGNAHTQAGQWDILIAHPPCTYLSNAEAARLFITSGHLNRERFAKGLEARDFFMEFWNADCPKIAIENPIPSGVYEMPKYTQVIEPYYFGDPYSKKTCLWLKGLPPLIGTDVVKPICSWVSGGSKRKDGTPRLNKGTTFRDSKRKSKTFQGIADAMADQWGDPIQLQLF